MDDYIELVMSTTGSCHASVFGVLKCHIVSAPQLTAKLIGGETKYHLHAQLDPGGGRPWDCAVNVGTYDRADPLNYKLVADFHYAIIDTLSADWSDLRTSPRHWRCRARR